MFVLFWLIWRRRGFYFVMVRMASSLAVLKWEALFRHRVTLDATGLLSLGEGPSLERLRAPETPFSLSGLLPSPCFAPVYCWVKSLFVIPFKIFLFSLFSRFSAGLLLKITYNPTIKRMPQWSFI